MPFDIEAVHRTVEKRNALRRSARLPLLNMADELAKAERLYGEARWAEFRTSSLRQRVAAQALARLRHRMGDPDFTPKGMLSGGGWMFSVQVDRQMAKLHVRLSQKAAAPHH